MPAPVPFPMNPPVPLDSSHIESYAFRDSSKFQTILNIGSKKSSVNIKVVNFETGICPEELKPVSGKCPEKFPVLNPHTNCCYKNLSGE